MITSPEESLLHFGSTALFILLDDSGKGAGLEVRQEGACLVKETGVDLWWQCITAVSQVILMMAWSWTSCQTEFAQWSCPRLRQQVPEQLHNHKGFSGSLQNSHIPNSGCSFSTVETTTARLQAGERDFTRRILGHSVNKERQDSFIQFLLKILITTE